MAWVSVLGGGVSDVRIVRTVVLEQDRGTGRGGGRSRLFDLGEGGEEPERRVRRARWRIGKVLDGFVGCGREVEGRFLMEKWGDEGLGVDHK